MIEGVIVNEYFGSALAVGDVDGDGIKDIVAGSPLATVNQLVNAGLVRVHYGRITWPSYTNANIENELLIINGSQALAECGHSLSTGNFNGDQYADMVIGCPRFTTSSGDYVGRTYVLAGKNRTVASVETINLATKINSTDTLIFNGINPSDQSGISVCSGYDADNDGRDDIIIGASNATAFGRSDAGQSYYVSSVQYSAQLNSMGPTPTQMTPFPTMAPTDEPTASPTVSPTISPTQASTVAPTISTTLGPTPEPTQTLTATPTLSPTPGPTSAPTDEPTASSTVSPTISPTVAPPTPTSVLPTTPIPQTAIPQTTPMPPTFTSVSFSETNPGFTTLTPITVDTITSMNEMTTTNGIDIFNTMPTSTISEGSDSSALLISVILGGGCGLIFLTFIVCYLYRRNNSNSHVGGAPIALEGPSLGDSVDYSKRDSRALGPSDPSRRRATSRSIRPSAIYASGDLLNVSANGRRSRSQSTSRHKTQSKSQPSDYGNVFGGSGTTTGYDTVSSTTAVIPGYGTLPEEHASLPGYGTMPTILDKDIPNSTPGAISSYGVLPLDETLPKIRVVKAYDSVLSSLVSNPKSPRQVNLTSKENLSESQKKARRSSKRRSRKPEVSNEYDTVASLSRQTKENDYEPAHSLLHR